MQIESEALVRHSFSKEDAADDGGGGTGTEGDVAVQWGQPARVFPTSVRLSMARGLMADKSTKASSHSRVQVPPCASSVSCSAVTRP